MLEKKIFPEKLYEVLMKGCNWMKWTEDGTGIVISDRKKLTEETLPVHFNQHSYGSFNRQLHAYGFKKYLPTPNVDWFYHPCFIRDKPELLSELYRHPPGFRKVTLQNGIEMRVPVNSNVLMTKIQEEKRKAKERAERIRRSNEVLNAIKMEQENQKKQQQLGGSGENAGDTTGGGGTFSNEVFSLNPSINPPNPLKTSAFLQPSLSSSLSPSNAVNHFNPFQHSHSSFSFSNNTKKTLNSPFGGNFPKTSQNYIPKYGLSQSFSYDSSFNSAGANFHLRQALTPNPLNTFSNFDPSKSISSDHSTPVKNNQKIIKAESTKLKMKFSLDSRKKSSLNFEKSKSTQEVIPRDPFSFPIYQSARSTFIIPTFSSFPFIQNFKDCSVSRGVKCKADMYCFSSFVCPPQDIEYFKIRLGLASE